MCGVTIAKNDEGTDMKSGRVLMPTFDATGCHLIFPAI